MSISDDFTTAKLLRSESKRLGIPLRQIHFKDKVRPDYCGAYIINLQHSSKGQGTHWTALWRTKTDDIYFDSYGQPPPLEIERWLRPYTYSTAWVQPLTEGGCGSYVIEFLQHMTEGGTLSSFLEQFGTTYPDRKTNRKVLRRLEKS